MALYTPKTLVAPQALTASAVTYYTTPGATSAVIRTIQVSSSASGKTFTISIGADAAGTRIYDATAITQNVPSIYNEWLVLATTVIIQAKATDTVPVLAISGLEYA